MYKFTRLQISLAEFSGVFCCYTVCWHCVARNLSCGVFCRGKREMALFLDSNFHQKKNARNKWRESSLLLKAVVVKAFSPLSCKSIWKCRGRIHAHSHYLFLLLLQTHTHIRTQICMWHNPSTTLGTYITNEYQSDDKGYIFIILSCTLNLCGNIKNYRNILYL